MFLMEKVMERNIPNILKNGTIYEKLLKGVNIWKFLLF